MSAYILFQFDPTNQEILEKHGKLVMETTQAYQAEFFMPPTANEALEGDSPRQMSVMLRFPSAEVARNWYESDAYQQGKHIRDGELNMLITLLG